MNKMCSLLLAVLTVAGAANAMAGPSITDPYGPSAAGCGNGQIDVLGLGLLCVPDPCNGSWAIILEGPYPPPC